MINPLSIRTANKGGKKVMIQLKPVVSLLGTAGSSPVRNNKALLKIFKMPWCWLWNFPFSSLIWHHFHIWCLAKRNNNRGCCQTQHLSWHMVTSAAAAWPPDSAQSWKWCGETDVGSHAKVLQLVAAVSLIESCMVWSNAKFPPLSFTTWLLYSASKTLEFVLLPVLRPHVPNTRMSQVSHSTCPTNTSIF